MEIIGRMVKPDERRFVKVNFEGRRDSP